MSGCLLIASLMTLVTGSFDQLAVEDLAAEVNAGDEVRCAAPPGLARSA